MVMVNKLEILFFQNLSKIIIKLFKAKSGIYNISSPNSISVKLLY